MPHKTVKYSTNMAPRKQKTKSAGAPKKDNKKKTTFIKLAAKQEPPFPLYDDVEEASFDQGWASVVALLKGRKKIAVLTGAGISVSCGIPDFRSKDKGTYLDPQPNHMYRLPCITDLFRSSSCCWSLTSADRLFNEYRSLRNAKCRGMCMVIGTKLVEAAWSQIS
jgi:Sir2 family